MTIDELFFLTRDELMMHICHLEEQIEKLKQINEQQSRKIFGMETTIAHYKEKEQKYYESLTYDNDIEHRQR